MDLHTEVKKKNKRLEASRPLPTYGEGCQLLITYPGTAYLACKQDRAKLHWIC